MAHVTIEKDGLTFTFYDQRTLGVNLRLADFAKLTDQRLTDESYQNAANILMLCAAYTVNITGTGALATYWAQYGKQRAGAMWDAAGDLTEDDLNLWWAAYDAVGKKSDDADFLAEGKKATDLP